MKKAELITAVAERSGYAKTVVAEVLATTSDVAREAVARHEDVFLFGVGKMGVVWRGEKKARDMHKGEPVVVPPRHVVVFRPSDSFDAAANGRQ